MSRPAKRLRVSIDVSAIPAQPVGVGRFTLDLVRTLRYRDDVDLTLWCRHFDARRWSLPPYRSGDRVEVRAPRARPVRLAWEQARLPGLLRRSGADVHHSPHYTMPERASLPRVVTIHDLTFFDHPEWHERSKVPFFRRAIRVAARRATALLCDSSRTAELLGERCSPSGRVFVVPLGVDLAKFRPTGPIPGSGPIPAHGGGPEGGPVAEQDGGGLEASSADDARRLEQLGVAAPYVAFLGTLEPRKAVPELVAAFDQVASRHRDLRLVLAGRPGWGADEVERAVATARHRDRVVVTGYVPEPAVPALLRGAVAVAYPARVEGFGLPALEALACGTALVTTAGTVMSDLAGEAALAVTPGSVAELAEALDAVVDAAGSVEAEHRRAAGLAVAAAHSWEASAAAHVAAYRWAAGAGTGTSTGTAGGDVPGDGGRGGTGGAGPIG